ncbi:msx2-interacting protein isoform X1 [Nerophis ophidion]|uniref:msx2-interacting protein isoform X1 n=1 Tax=Nerophis ophidion TaxID=159077 RepID=UPI002ADFA919|nr:msx2-interacting protein isoform X1 [Nerophis ophidion]
MVRETRHLWVGNLPENVREEKIIEHFKRYGRVESVKVLPKRGSEGGVAAFVDFVDIKSAQKAHNAVNKMGDRDLRTDYNEPGTIPSAARGLDDSLSLGSRGRDVSGFTRAAGGAVYGPPTSLHGRDGRYERRLDGTAESRERAYDHSTYGHHERAGSSFERQRHYDTDYYTRERTLSSSGTGSGTSLGNGTALSAGVGSIVNAIAGNTGATGAAGSATGGNGGSTASGVGFYRSHSRSPCRFETPEPRYEPRTREAFTLASVVHRDLYREDRGRRGERSYRHSRSRSPHSTHSRNPSPQRLASQATRPPCSHSRSGSRSRSSSSDSVSSTSSSTSGSDSSSSSSDESPARSVQSAAIPAPSALPLSSLDKEEPRKSFGIKVQNLPVRSTDTSLKDGLFHEFKKHGKVTSVQIHGASEERYGLVFFRQQEDQEKALGASKGKLFFGMQIDVTAWNGPETESENEFRPLDERIDEFHPKATRTLFIGNLEKTTTYHDLLNIFQRFGEIVDIDIKKVNGAPQYAFLQYCDIASVCKAIKKMDGEYLGNNRLKLGFGKSMPTTCVWLDGLASNTTEQFLTRHFCRYGHVVKVVFDRMKGMALILYNNIEYAQAAVKDTKGWKIGGTKIKVDFANQESQMAFYRSMQASGQDIRDFYDILSERRDDRRSQYEFQTERQYYENVRTPGTYAEDPRRKYTARSREFYTEWDPYQGDYYDPQYYEDTREYREYRADPYEQDIRKYSYLQRERERERERFETDRGHDHGRRTVERSQSPTLVTSRRPASPTVSPSLSERIPNDSDRQICCRSSERSGSCSSVSPPRFEKLEKLRPERYIKTEKFEKDRVFEVEMVNIVEKEKRTGRKDRGDKDKSERQRLKKLKITSPIIQTCDTEPELDRHINPDLTQSTVQSKNSKIPKDGSIKAKLDLLPCVVQLTRVKEKEVKLISHEKQVLRGGSDSPRLASPSADQRSPLFRTESTKGDLTKQAKTTRDKSMHSVVEHIDMDVKIKSKKHGKSEISFDSGISMDFDRLAARKRRFEDSGKNDRQKRISEDDLGTSVLLKPWNNKDPEFEKNVFIKKMLKKEHNRDKSVRIFSINSPNEGQHCENNSLSRSTQPKSQPAALSDEHSGPLHYPYLKMELLGSKSENTSSLAKTSSYGTLNLDDEREVLCEKEQSGKHCRESEDEEQSAHIGQTNAFTKNTEQNRWLHAKLCDLDKRDVKYDTSSSNEAQDFGTDYVTHDMKKSNRDINNDDFSLCKRKRNETFDSEIVTSKIERHFGTSQKLDEEILERLTSTAVAISLKREDETIQISASVINKDRKSPIIKEDMSNTQSLKNSLGLKTRHFQTSGTEQAKLKTSFLGCSGDLVNHWVGKVSSDSPKMEMAFPSELRKHETIGKCLGQDLEPGEVQSDSDDDGDRKRISPKSSRSLSYILRERDERMTEMKLSGSLEKNKFYSFALDKTITPDTKALLERAKTLYSAREDNWSFLPSRFPTTHSYSDKNKVELAPRPIPSWYMKKKKTRANSDENLHEKKEELKPHDQERQELFASRFLHSSIFEQDSRRLQHLERKEQHSETGVEKDCTNPGVPDVKTESEDGDVPREPIVLFRSRFLELQQQRDKGHCPLEHENNSVGVDIKHNLVPGCDDLLSDEKTTSTESKVDEKSLCAQVTPTSVSPSLPCPKETPLPENNDVVTPPVDQYVPSQQERVEPVPDASLSPPVLEILKALTPELTINPPLLLSEPENEVETNIELIVPKVELGESLTMKQNHPVEVKPLTPGSCVTSLERENADTSDTFLEDTKVKNVCDEKTESKTETQETHIFEESKTTEIEIEVCMPEMEVEKPVTNRRQPKNKRAKTLPILRTTKPPPKDKPATRKSERIDREKLKRSSSSRAEASKGAVECKTTSKSSTNATESEQNIESTLVHGRTRRRNVRSVYATIHEGEQPAKEVVEPSRTMRKRITEKEPIQQDIQIPTTNPRRGRPPKRGVKPKVDNTLLIKVDSQKTDESTHVGENSTTPQVVKSFEGWRSPRTQKVQQTQMTSSNPVNKKVGRFDKPSEGTTVEQTTMTNVDESELKPKDCNPFEKLPEKIDTTLQTHKKEKGAASFSTNGNIENTTTESKHPEISVKMKTPRLKRNTKQAIEDKSHTLRNLEIRVSVDDVKGLLRSENDDSESFEASIKKTKTLVEKEESKTICFPKQSKELDMQNDEDAVSEAVLPASAILAHQMELEQAVENIAKLTVEQTPRPYKETATAQPPALPPAVSEPQSEVEEEKRANPSSETELAAAIDSITAEEACAEADADAFTAPPTFTALIPTPDSLLSASSSEMMEPETHMVINNILAADSDDGLSMSSPKGLTAESKITADSPCPVTPKKIGKVRAKTQRKSRTRKCAVNKKEKSAKQRVHPEPSPLKLPESIPEDPEIINSKAAVITTGTTVAGSVVTAVATCRRDVASAISLGTPKEAEQPEVEQPVPKESAFHSNPSTISNCKKHLQAAEPSSSSLTPAPARLQPMTQSGVPLIRPAKMAISPSWPQRTEESRIFIAPPCQVTVATSSVSASTSLGHSSINPQMPPDTKASDVNPSSSTLRKILMEPKYVSASHSNSIPSTTVTSTLSDPLQMSENENPSVAMGPKHVEERFSLPPQSMHHKPSPLTESQKNCAENTQHTVISPATSVISRIPIPYDTDETPRISLSSRSMCQFLPKQKFRANSNENNRNRDLDTVKEATRGRSVVETSRSLPGLRVNTSEGVVVLSYSGQKTEGPHRMRAKISQIPQASAGDIEFQQSVPKSHTKQDSVVASSQTPNIKLSLSPSAYGHTSVLSSSQYHNAQPVISCTKQDSRRYDKPEVSYHTTSPGSVVKMFPQPVSSPQVLVYNQPVIQKQHGNRLGTETLPKRIDVGKSVQQSNLSPIKNPHHPSFSGSRSNSSPATLTDRAALHLKQDPQSPQTVHSPSPFGKPCTPGSSPGTSVVMGHGMSIPAYSAAVQHPHSEQSSVIMQPQSVTQCVTNEARMNATPMSAINYGRRSNSLSSPLQHSGISQSVVIRQSHSASQGSLSSGGVNEEDSRPFNQDLSRPSVPQLQSDGVMLHSDRRGHHPSLCMDQYRDMHQRILTHQQLGEQAGVETRHASDPGTTSSSNITSPSQGLVVRKSSEISRKEAHKPLEGQLIHSPTNESRIRTVHASSPVMVSPHPHGIQLVHHGSAASFPVYHDTRGFPPQLAGHSSSVHSLVNQSCTSSQIPLDHDLGHRRKMPQSFVGVGDVKPESPHLRRSTSSDIPHMSRIPREGVSPSYQSPMTTPIGLNHKPELSPQKSPPGFLTTPLPVVPTSSSLQPRPDAKTERSGHRSIDMVQLLTKYPIMWQGLLALKNDQAAVQLHFVSGNTLLAQRSLPPPEGGSLLRIVQRMRLEASQLDSVARRLTVDNDYCLLLALPCGRDQEDVLSQTQALKSGFITYLQAKQAAGIINVPNPGSNQPAYVVQIFPPCDFSEIHLSRLAPDLLNSISSISPHLMIVIASV